MAMGGFVSLNKQEQEEALSACVVGLENPPSFLGAHQTCVQGLQVGASLGWAGLPVQSRLTAEAFGARSTCVRCLCLSGPMDAMNL